MKSVSVSVCYLFRMKNRYRYVIQFTKSVSVSVRLKSSKSVRIRIGKNRFKVNRSISSNFELSILDPVGFFLVKRLSQMQITPLIINQEVVFIDFELKFM